MDPDETGVLEVTNNPAKHINKEDDSSQATGENDKNSQSLIKDKDSQHQSTGDNESLEQRKTRDKELLEIQIEDKSINQAEKDNNGLTETNREDNNSQQANTKDNGSWQTTTHLEPRDKVAKETEKKDEFSHETTREENDEQQLQLEDTGSKQAGSASQTGLLESKTVSKGLDQQTLPRESEEEFKHTLENPDQIQESRDPVQPTTTIPRETEQGLQGTSEDLGRSPESKDIVQQAKTIPREAGQELQGTSDNIGQSHDYQQSDNDSHQTSDTSKGTKSQPAPKEEDNRRQKTLDKSQFWVVMATSILSALLGATIGALFVTLQPRWISPGSDYKYTLYGLQSGVDQCKAMRQQDDLLVRNLASTVHNLTTDFERLQKNLIASQTETKQNYTRLSDNVMLKNFVVDSQIEELKHFFLSKEWLFIIILMGLLEFVAIWAIWQMYQRLDPSFRQNIQSEVGISNVTIPNTASGDSGVIQGDRKLLKRITKATLQSQVCVVCFHSLDKHAEKVKVILSQNEGIMQVTLKKHLVSRHENILQLPPSRLYMVFVDFNERNVILEDPNKGLGDLRLTTVQAMHIMGADIILTYSSDKGSRTLTPGALYNHDLSSVRQHPELCRLDNQQRMLSVFKEFNDTQRGHIASVITDVIK